MPKISAEDANKLGLVCRYGHTGKWKPVLKHQGKHLSRMCMDCVIIHKRKTVYGLSNKQYEELVVAQKGLCFICSRAVKLVVDHNHETKEVRSLLCNKCNVMVGYVESGHMKRFEDYVERFSNSARSRVHTSGRA